MTDPFKEKADSALSSLHLSDWEKHRLFTNTMEEQNMKKKMPAVLIIAIALILALGGVTVAEKINLFTSFSNFDERLIEVSYSSVLNDLEPITVETPELGTSVVTITNAHFDGENLILGYSVENRTFAENFTPTEEEISTMRKVENDAVYGFMNASHAQDELSDAYHRAVRLGLSRGVRGVSISTEFLIFDEQKNELSAPLCYEFNNRDAENVTSHVRVHGPNYDPLPEKFRNADSITVEVPIYKTSFALWNDSTGQYVKWNHELLKTLTLTIPRSETVLPATDFHP
ncbi:MAG: hypothetical protein IKT57_07630 [Clostridia bacterium]|nr:hypothetical protein [Clostridia bacterium]